MFLKFCQILGISSGCVQGVFRVCSECVQSAFRVRSECVQSVFRVRSECVLGVFRVCTGCVQGAFRVCSECGQSAFSVCSECVQSVFNIEVISSPSASSVSIFGIFKEESTNEGKKLQNKGFQCNKKGCVEICSVISGIQQVF